MLKVFAVKAHFFLCIASKQHLVNIRSVAKNPVKFLQALLCYRLICAIFRILQAEIRLYLVALLIIEWL